MLSLKDRIKLLEVDLLGIPPRISVYHDLPFAILRYDPAQEWQVRRQIDLLSSRVRSRGQEVIMISLAALLWEAIGKSEGLDTLFELEKEMGYAVAEGQVTTYLSDPDWAPLPELLANRLRLLDPDKHIVFLYRAAAMGPSIYPMSRLLDEMHGRTLVRTVLFYPGTMEGTAGLKFLSLQGREPTGNYRVKVYG